MTGWPIWGAGYNGFWGSDFGIQYIWKRSSWAPQQGHNGYLDILNELGLVGALLFLIVLLYTLRKAWRIYRRVPDVGLVLILFLSCIVLRNVTESTFMRGTAVDWVLFLLVYGMISGYPLRVRRRRKVRVPRAV